MRRPPAQAPAVTYDDVTEIKALLQAMVTLLERIAEASEMTRGDVADLTQSLVTYELRPEWKGPRQ